MKSCCHTISIYKHKYVLSKAVQTQVRLLLMEQPDLGLHCLPIYSKRFAVLKVHQISKNISEKKKHSEDTNQVASKIYHGNVLDVPSFNLLP